MADIGTRDEGMAMMFAAKRSVGAPLAAILASTALTLAVGGGTGTAAVAAQETSVRAATVEVREGDGFIALQRRNLPSGSVTFEIKNVGTVPHGLSIKGHGVSSTSEIVRPGGSATLTVTLKKGRYLLWCPVDLHRKHGMVNWVRVK